MRVSFQRILSSALIAIVVSCAAHSQTSTQNARTTSAQAGSDSDQEASPRVAQSPKTAQLKDPVLVSRPESVVNGGVFVLEISQINPQHVKEVRFLDQVIPTIQTSDPVQALIGVDVFLKAGRYAVDVFVQDATTPRRKVRHWITVVDGAYPEEHLTLPPKKVSQFSPQTLKRIGSEKRVLDGLWETTTSTRYWKGTWQWPVPGKISSKFGKKRFMNGQPKNPHTGVDHKAAKGVPIQAINGGRVVLTGDQFFSGNAVILDHGHGLYSMYFHLSKINVQRGDRVTRGHVLGQVGSTGRATGPHLHWGLRLLGARVDPERLLPLLNEKKL